MTLEPPERAIKMLNEAFQEIGAKKRAAVDGQVSARKTEERIEQSENICGLDFTRTMQISLRSLEV